MFLLPEKTNIASLVGDWGGAATPPYRFDGRAKLLLCVSSFASMIALDLQTFNQSRQSGNVTGVIYVELRSGAFPETAGQTFL